MENACIIDNNVCRICFQTQYNTISLYTEKDGSSLYEKLINHTKLDLAINDGGLNCICEQCHNELKVLIEFLKKCERANELFVQYKEKNLDVFDNNTEYNEDSEKIFPNDYTECRNTDDNKIIKNLKENTQFSKVKENANLSPVKHICQYCSKVFTRKFNLKLHVMRHSGQVPPVRRRVTRHACPAPGCGKTFTSITNLNTHIRRHNGERPYACTECGKTFRSSTTLSDHKRIHTGVKPYMCPTCGKRFTTNKLSAHMRTHAPRTRRPPPARAAHVPPHAPRACALCAARYCHSQSLNKHMRKRHGLKTSTADTNQQTGFT